MPVRESPDELTIRAEEVGTWKSCTNIAEGRWSPPLVELIGTPSAKRYTKASKEKTGESKMMLEPEERW